MVADTTRAMVADGTRQATSVSLMYLINQVELASRARLDEITAERGITTIQYTAMTVLERHPGMISAQLARNSFVRAQSMAQLVDQLERRGLVEKTRDPSSRRQMLISLTASGQRLLDEIRGPVDEIEAEMTAGLTREETAVLAEALRTCRVALAGTQAH